MPEASILEGPGVGQRTVAGAIKQSQLLSPPFIELLALGTITHPVVEQTPEPKLVGQVRVDFLSKRVLVGEHTRQMREDPGHTRASGLRGMGGANEAIQMTVEARRRGRGHRAPGAMRRS